MVSELNQFFIPSPFIKLFPNIQFWFKCLAFHVRIPSNGHTINSLEAYFRPCSYPIQIKSDHQCVLEQVRVAVWQKWREKYLLQVNISKYFIEKKKQNFVFFVSFFFHFFSPHCLQPWSAARVAFPSIHYVAQYPDGTSIRTLETMQKLNFWGALFSSR